MRQDWPTKRDGDELTASDLNAIYREVERRAKVGVGPGLALSDGPAGLAIDATPTPRMYARLTGGYSSGYPWREVEHIAPNSWREAERTGSAAVDPAFDAGGKTDLTAGDRVYRMRRDVSSGQWIFRHREPCCSPDDDTCQGRLLLSVWWCTAGFAVPGAAVRLKSGVTTISEGVTNALGDVELTFPTAGTCTLEVDAIGLWQGYSGTITLICGPNASVIYLDPIAGYFCCGCPTPVEDCASITFSDGLGTVTLNRIALGVYEGCALRSVVTNSVYGAAGYNACTGASVAATISVPVRFRLNCAGALRVTVAGYEGTGGTYNGDVRCPSAWLFTTGLTCSSWTVDAAGFSTPTHPCPGPFSTPVRAYWIDETIPVLRDCAAPIEIVWTRAFPSQSCLGGLLSDRHPLYRIYGTSATFTATWCS